MAKFETKVCLVNMYGEVVCELHCVSEWEVIGAMLDAIEDMGIDITEYM